MGDLRRKLRARPTNALIVIVVDASESMGTRDRLIAARGAALSFLASAYTKRDRVALITFAGERADVLLEPTRSITRAKQTLQQLPFGGATPLANGLVCAQRLVQAERQRHPLSAPLLVLISDGEANVPLLPGQPIEKEIAALAEQIRKQRLPVVAIDPAPAKERPMRRIARALDARYHAIEQVSAGFILKAIASSPSAGR